MKWQPIETIPNDCGEVDLYGYTDYDKLEGRLTDCEFIDGVWMYFEDGVMNPVTDIGFNPTHWMPLPLPPVVE